MTIELEPNDEINISYELLKHSRNFDNSHTPVTPETVNASTNLLKQWWSESGEWRSHFKNIASSPTKLQITLLSILFMLLAGLMVLVLLKLLYLNLITKTPGSPDIRMKSEYLFSTLGVIFGVVVAACALTYTVWKMVSAWNT